MRSVDGPRPRAPWLLGAACALALGCYSGRGDAGGAADGGDGTAGQDDGAGSDAGDGDDGTKAEPGECAAQIAAQPLRRLTPLQYQNTIRDLFGDAEFQASYADEAEVTTQLGVRQFRSDAEQVLSRRDAWTQPVFPCDTSGAADDACVEALISDFGRRALRRPVDAETHAWLRASYDAAIAEGLPFADAMDVLLATILQAPELVYRFEAGEPVEGQPTLRRLDDYEIASRLSYFLWDTMPDAELFAAAGAGQLGSDSGLRAQVERMLADPRSEGKLQHFVSSWLQLDGGRLHLPLEESFKDAELFPEYGAPLQAAMREELEAFVHRVFYEEDGAFERLFLARDAYVNGALADLYGVTDGPIDDDTWAWVQLPEDQRAGLLTRAAFLTVFSAARPQSPIRRGVFVIEEMMCLSLGEPPPNANDTPVDGGEGEDDQGNPIVRSVRQDVELRTQTGTCNDCHSVINPVGFTLEHYDAIGRWQDIEVVSGQPVDASGMVIGDVAGPVNGGVELSMKLAQSEDVRECFADRWLSQALGVDGASIDGCTQAAVRQAFVESGDMRELLAAIVLSDAFRFLNTAEAE